VGGVCQHSGGASNRLSPRTLYVVKMGVVRLDNLFGNPDVSGTGAIDPSEIMKAKIPVADVAASEG
jgi:hypothetical protein